MAITTLWHDLHQEEDQVYFRLTSGCKGYVFCGIDHLLAPYSADDCGDHLVTVHLQQATINTIEELAKAGGARLISKNWFGFGIVDGVMNLVTWYERPGSLVRYGLFYTNKQVVPQFESMIREPEKPFDWGPQEIPRRISRYERGWVI